MKIDQLRMFEVNNKKLSSKYSCKIETPIYEPSEQKPHVLELVNTLKTNKLIRNIEQSSLPNHEKKFLIEAAHRHSVFNYEKIADYYANSTKEMQELMEESALVIVDFKKAIQSGYVKLCEEIEEQYRLEYGKQ